MARHEIPDLGCGPQKPRTNYAHEIETPAGLVVIYSWQATTYQQLHGYNIFFPDSFGSRCVPAPDAFTAKMIIQDFINTLGGNDAPRTP